MIKIERVKEIPPAIADTLSNISCVDFTTALPLLSTILLRSPEVYYLHEDDTPLLIIGAVRPTLTNDRKEIWMFGSKYLEIGHLRECRDRFRDWCSVRKGTYFVRVNDATRAKFVKFFGFQFKDSDGPIDTYEVVL